MKIKVAAKFFIPLLDSGTSRAKWFLRIEAPANGYYTHHDIRVKRILRIFLLRKLLLRHSLHRHGTFFDSDIFFAPYLWSLMFISDSYREYLLSKLQMLTILISRKPTQIQAAHSTAIMRVCACTPYFPTIPRKYAILIYY